MKWSNCLRLLLVVMLLAGWCATAAPESAAAHGLYQEGGDEEEGEQEIDEEALVAEIIQLEEGTAKHLIEHDAEAAEAEMNEEFFFITAAGQRLVRADYVASLGDENVSVTSLERGETEAIVLGPDAVLLVYPVVAEGEVDGAPFTSYEYVSSLWARRDGVWLNVFLQGTPIVEAAAEADAEARIANAESAAPTAIAEDATVLGFPGEEGGDMVVLRQGDSSWTCIEDWPASPGNDPACLDATFMAWNDAMAASDDFSADKPGIAYMLQGGSDASNTDPFAMEPADGEEWISTPPHIMLIAPSGFDPDQYASEPSQDIAYIMWEGTPYEHLMVPVVAMDHEAMGDADADARNTMSAAPAGIVENATILANPEEEGGEMVTVHEGSNGFVCYPDNPVSPGNDPSCNDAIWNGMDAAKSPDVERPGISYMLAGGSDASATDPDLVEPPQGEEWVSAPPHLMLLMPGGFDAADFPYEHASGYPYIMFDDTWIEHLMIPVADMPAEHQ